MIVYRHPSQQPITPPWLDGFEPLQPWEVVRRDTERGHLVGVGEALVFTMPGERAWLDIEDGWQVALAGPINPAALFRLPRWCRTDTIPDLQGRAWRAPIILDGEGARDFQHAYGGRDFLPVLTPVQQRCEAVARAARDAIPAGIDMGPEACRWAAVLLAAANAISEDAIAALAILDAPLVVGVLATATGLPMRHDA